LLAQKTDYRILARHKDDLTVLEAILFGQAGMLEGLFNDAYPSLLQREYNFYRHKYKLEPLDISLWKFGKLRPANFPTIRIAQFAKLIYKSRNLFNKVTELNRWEEIRELFDSQCSPYWLDHYRFDKPTKSKSRNLGSSAIENIVINTIIPLKFIYGKVAMKPEIQEQALSLITQLPAEKNSVIRNWVNAGITPRNAGESQALLELKKYYCTPKKCLHCAIGHSLVRKGQ
jgi:hypothetical protein